MMTCLRYKVVLSLTAHSLVVTLREPFGNPTATVAHCGSGDFYPGTWCIFTIVGEAVRRDFKETFVELLLSSQ